nr:CoA transferase [Actinomycetota bacterium]
GGFCSLLLADFGADVLKVEDTGMGDYIRWSPPVYEGAEQSAGSALFLSLNRNKTSIRLNLKSDEGRDVLLRLVRDADVLLESFRPGVLDRLGVGWERLREENPRLVYCAITGYGQTGPYTQRAGHDMNYLGLVGLLGLTGAKDGPPVQAAGQIADLGGGALMAAFGIMAALHERERSGEGQLVDVSMADGALSWLAMVAARYFAEGRAPGRGELELAGSLVCYRPYECSDGWVSLGALEPKFWQAWCRGVGREDLIEQQFAAPGSPAHAEVEQVFLSRTRDEWKAFNDEHDCCLEPVLGLDEALASDLVREREMVAELDQPGVAEPVRLLGVPVKMSRTPGDASRLPGPVLGEHTEEVLRGLGYDDGEIAALVEAGAVAGPVTQSQGSFLG